MTTLQEERVANWVKVMAFPILVGVVIYFMEQFHQENKESNRLLQEIRVEVKGNAVETRAIQRELEAITKRVDRIEQNMK
jgi:hypothetical protein